MKVLILGCGPAGLMAAHAATLAGHSVFVVSKKRKSELFGAQYLHGPIPGMTEGGPIRVKYVLQGTSEGYKQKVYGSQSRVTVSPDTLEEDHDGWDLRATYWNLWNEYEPSIIDGPNLDGPAVDLLTERWSPDFVISTIPAPFLCSDERHVFRSESVWAIGDAPERGVRCPIRQAPNNTVICNGEDAPAWYRAANIFGYCTAEWPTHKRPPLAVSEVIKPIDTTCTCRPYIMRAGRYGLWRKGVLSHSAFQQVQRWADLVEEQGIQGELL